MFARRNCLLKRRWTILPRLDGVDTKLTNLEMHFCSQSLQLSLILHIILRTFADPMSHRLKIICLHGFTSNGAVHARQMRRITKLLPEYEFLFPDGPHKVDIESQMDLTQPESKAWSEIVNGMSSSGHRAWYFAREHPDSPEMEGSFVGLESSLEFIGSMLEDEAPVHAIMGFSQGAGLAGMLCALLQTDQKEHVLRNLMPANIVTPQAGVIFSGFKARFSQYDSIYKNGINVPILHVVGTGDSLVRTERSQALIHLCTGAKILTHEGGHNIPKGDDDTTEIAHFIREHVNGTETELR